MTSTAEPNYWSLLGLEPDSDADALKRAFRREARRWHPDLNSNDRQAEERFKLVNEAYAVLSDPKRRRLWEGGGDQGTVSTDPFASGFPDFDDYLDVVLGGGPYRREPSSVDPMDDQPEAEADSEPSGWPTTAAPPPPPVRAAESIETEVLLTPDQALLGTPVELELSDGTVVEVQTPPQAGDGWRLRLAGVAPGGGDHFLHLRVQTNDGLRIDGLRVLYRLDLLPADAALGCAVDVPTLSGPVTLQVPPGSSSGRLLRLRGRGLEFEDRRGDQLVEIVVVIPAELSDAERALYRRLQELALEASD
ncbi:MAG: DnaJ C-terminal domain-containing protein [Synechococcus sp.]|nr:DnaJ C-terminal domain-containing protein [Synechococcus sp.]